MEGFKYGTIQKWVCNIAQPIRIFKKIRRLEVADALRFATELGDLRENAEYDAACQDYQDVEREIYKLEQELKNVKIISKVDTTMVTIDVQLY